MIPTATYRLQFRNGMTFDRAAALVPYLKNLGISHLYASPIFTATKASTHGYDVTDANEIEPSLGGREGFERLVAELKAQGLGLIIDIVPNHMASSLENAWWRDVLEYGKESRYARHFDIDWSRRLTLPFLGDTFDAVLENGEIAIKPDPATGKPTFAYYDNYYPLAPATWQGREAEILALTDKAAIADLHERQPWKLMSWRDAARSLSYRRFFEVTGLVGMRVEDKTVFDDTHRLILELVRTGAVDGLRIDHIDGLADPKAYLARLRQEVGPACYITVEKILAKGEQLPDDWPVSGTTGYEFIASLAEVLVDDEQIDNLRQAYETVTGAPVDMRAELRAAKLLMVDRNFEGEFTRLLALALSIASELQIAQEESVVRQALRELLIAFPVYRTYGTAEGLPPTDICLLHRIVERVKTLENPPQPEALTFLSHLLTGDVPASSQEEATQFRVRFQQLTGPLMAKSVEDTLFFRQNMGLALNEVGAEPVTHHFSIERFHHEMKTRQARQPDALSGTSTHDTKRGEDARARLYTLTEAPEQWSECLARWRQMNQTHVKFLNDGTAPKSADTWMLYQALTGVWPPMLQPQDETGLNALKTRFEAFVEKALREAKLRTDWVDSNEAYETAMLDYARYLLAPDNQTFLQDFYRSLQPFIRAGLVNSLTQTVIKLTAPGVPDIYQGSETLNFSLVDPDNRREPDFATLAQQLDQLTPGVFSREESWLNGQVNQYVTAALLRLRQQNHELFRFGDYIPLRAVGQRADKVIAYARVNHDDALIVVAPRLVFAECDGLLSQSHSGFWSGTDIIIPGQLNQHRYRNVLTQERLMPGEHLSLASHQGGVLVLMSD
ncbi:malto-oligosyltrehalose synthase [Salmonella enterica subsp. enterica serovar Newport]|uniref:malto-oligosyltrehalose synthase n=1 Tax=Salmonella enterica TaxID=28901 RepID=UPI000973CD0B|nr:malto-oligosyltrehalose synthase [Salmonella enterica]ECF6886099.1 malto-oligosyltrehalose synthase [Salmonella enterica subsp. enterica]ECM1977530.1 malto-oligosyltrehalose synthase [Salmonella enterica subsp. enterica serovar Newport]EGI6009948.1 malto-oligosyltrehalose synthase [Salmonella enterica subsp. enterica serovar Bangkok]APY54824.1 malto-oligosyltrehalose synthase [Salmonella enterica subsp. enterica serovar Djakarta str. S-1087]ECH7786370.1 malto-oligosyltrehalose synthase [Sal